MFFAIGSLPAVQLGAYYDPRLLPDFGGDVFDLKEAKLVQHDIVDSDGKLVAPWEIYDKLRPGTLVLINAKLFVWHTSDAEDRRTYQIIAERIKIIEESDQPIEPREVVNMEAPVTPTKCEGKARRTDADNAFDGFQSPVKKNRLS